MADIRERDQPGTVPRPRRDGGGRGTRTGSPGGQDAGEDALAWSVAAMSGALRRIGDASGADVPQAVAAATEAVWWVTVVDAAITRHCPAAYRGALAALDPAARRAVERSVAGLRFIRGQLGYSADPGDFIQPAPGAPAAAWTWRSVPPPSPQRGTVRDTSPYREYRTQLAGLLHGSTHPDRRLPLPHPHRHRQSQAWYCRTGPVSAYRGFPPCNASTALTRDERRRARDCLASAKGSVLPAQCLGSCAPTPATCPLVGVTDEQGRSGPVLCGIGHPQRLRDHRRRAWRGMSSRLRPAGSGSTRVSAKPSTAIPAVSSSVPRRPNQSLAAGTGRRR